MASIVEDFGESPKVGVRDLKRSAGSEYRFGELRLPPDHLFESVIHAFPPAVIDRRSGPVRRDVRSHFSLQHIEAWNLRLHTDVRHVGTTCSQGVDLFEPWTLINRLRSNRLSARRGDQQAFHEIASAKIEQAQVYFWTHPRQRQRAIQYARASLRCSPKLFHRGFVVASQLGEFFRQFNDGIYFGPGTHNLRVR